ncbi:MAG TPA: sigma-70 family RNA polymerase sigma factor, partial [Gammaproteobacteria bacterium]|nr:sigma-70 family RNA polymerase sigma factor [Gammaproteobacteria bacterium]
MSSKKTVKPILANIAYHPHTKTFSLLSQAKEIQLAKKIERHYKKILWSATQCPDVLDVLHAHFHQITQGQLELNTFVCGFMFEEHSVNAKSPTRNLKTMQTKMISLSVLQSLLKEQMQNFGRQDKSTLASQQSLAEYLNTFKWASPMIETLVQAIQSLPDDSDIPQINRLKSKLDAAFEGFKAAKKEMFEASLRLVFSIAKKYHSEGLEYSDLVQEGNVGLKEAIDRFEYRFGYSFPSYATWWIKQSILSFITKHKFDVTLSNNPEDESTSTPVDSVSAHYLSKMTNNALSSLSDREARILCMWFGIGLESEHTVEEITLHFNISFDDLRRIETKALKALLRQQGL